MGEELELLPGWGWGERLELLSLGHHTHAERSQGSWRPRCLYSCGFTLFALRWVALNLHEILGVGGVGSLQPWLELLAWMGIREAPGLVSDG